MGTIIMLAEMLKSGWPIIQNNFIYSYCNSSKNKSESVSMVNVIIDDIVSESSADSNYLTSKIVDEVVELPLEEKSCWKDYTRMDCY